MHGSTHNSGKGINILTPSLGTHSLQLILQKHTKQLTLNPTLTPPPPHPHSTNFC